MRENYLWQYLSDWAGDDAVITHIHDEIRKFNYMGDVQRVTGEVLAKRQDGKQGLVDVAVKFTNQRDEETVRARSEEHTSELQSLLRISYADFCLKNTQLRENQIHTNT